MLQLAWWQVFELVASVGVAILVGGLVGKGVHAAIYRRALLGHTERFVERLADPLIALGIVVAWEVTLTFLELPGDVVDGGRVAAQIALLVALAWLAARLVDGAIEVYAGRSRWITAHRLSQSLLPVVRRIVKVALAAVVVVMVLAILGYAVGALIVGLAIAGVALALAAHKTLENVFGAFALGVDHPFREGDFVRLDGGLAGTVEEIGLRSTRIRTPDHIVVTVPNGKLADAQIETLSDHDRMRLELKVRLQPGANAAQLDRVLGELRRLFDEHPQRGADEASVHLVPAPEGWLGLHALAWFDSPSWDAFEVLRDQLLVQCLAVIAASGVGLVDAPARPTAVPVTHYARSAGGMS